MFKISDMVNMMFRPYVHLKKQSWQMRKRRKKSHVRSFLSYFQALSEHFNMSAVLIKPVPINIRGKKKI